MSQIAIATNIGSQLASKVQGITDEEVIKTLTIEAWNKLKAAIPNSDSFNTRGLTTARKAFKKVFPDSEIAKPAYFYTTLGKGQVPRYEHLVNWYLTSNTERWDKVREAYFENLPSLTAQSDTQPEPQSEPQPKSNPTLKLEDMTLAQLELDNETQEIVQNALNHSGMTLADFVKQACKVYARTVVGKAQQATKSGLESIPTVELLNNSKLRTLPGRAEELSNRAIQAIMHHNDMATEKSQQWCISATAINALTGSKMTLIKTVMEKCKLKIDDHNTKHALNPYDNRGRSTKIEEDIDFVNFSENDVSVAIVKPVNVIVPATIKIPKLKVQEMKPALTLEILDYLKQNPNTKVRVREDRKAIHYLPVTDDNGNVTGIKIEETEEVISL